MDVVQSASQATRVAVQGAAAQPGVTGPAVPGHDPVVERQPQRRQVLVGGHDGRQVFERRSHVIAEEADQPAQERRGVGRHDDRAVEARNEPAGDGEGIRTRRGRLQDRDRVGGQVGPARVAPRSSALEQDQAREIPEGLGGIDRPARGESIGESAEAKRRSGPG